MRCVNCDQEFELKGKGYKRTSFISEKRSEQDIKGVLDINITPKTSKKDSRFLCTVCEKFLKSASEGQQSKEELFKRTGETSYISRKRKLELSPQPSPKNRKTTQTTTTSSKRSAGAKYFANYKYKQGFRYYMKSKAAVRVMRSIIGKETRKGMKKMLKHGNIPNVGTSSVESFKKMSFSKLVKEVKSYAPFLYDTLQSSMSGKSTHGNLRQNKELIPILGTIMSIIINQVSPRKASLLQKMNAVQMWRAGCRRSLFQSFKRMGFSVSEKTLLSTLDVLRRSFDTELTKWKAELQNFVCPDVLPASPEIDIDVLHASPVTSEIETSESEATNVPTTSESESDDEWEDVIEGSDDSGEEADETIQYGDPAVPKGYTLCWDNVGKQVRARHHTRNHGNKYKCWALAYVAKNRVQTTHFDDTKSIPASDIPIASFFVTNLEADLVREEMVLMVQRIMAEYMSLFQPFKESIAENRHVYDAESAEKSELFNIGVLDENPSSTAGVINIIEQLHKYVPKKADGSPFKLITWGDGLSCERHVDAQNARANGVDPFAKLQGLEPGLQEFHKRMILMQDTMDKLFSGKSASEKGTLFQLKNLFNQRSVSKNVSESFNYVSDFLKFVTEGYVILFALDMLGLDGLSHVPAEVDYDTAEDKLQTISQDIVNEVWNNIVKVPSADTDADGNEYCTCREEIEDSMMIECDNQGCEFGEWFHLECKGLDEDHLPETWYCCIQCEKSSYKSPENSDGKFEYVKTLIWRGLSDMVRRDAVRKNNGPLITLYWKVDLLEFARYNHTKYLILAQRLIASLNGFVTERLRQDLIWNRTVNLRGGRGNNDEADLVNEFLNRDFKDSLRSAGPHTTYLTLERHGKLTGGLGNVIDKIYGELTDVGKRHGKQTASKRLEDLEFFVEFLRGENLTSENKGRAFKSFPKSKNIMKVDIKKLCQKIKQCSKKLDRAKRVAH